MQTEQIYTAQNGIQVRYKHKPSKYDFKHLIIVFSGFLNAKPGNYDFANALNDCPADVLWIGDHFNDNYAYYLCEKMDFSIEEAIIEFIYHQLNNLNLNIENVTATGFSKGGSAALYYGLKLKLNYIVASVPQIKLGSYLAKYWQDTAKFVMGNGFTAIEIKYLDKKIVQLLKQETKFDRNIYLLTSEADSQYASEIAPYLTDFAQYSNFNLLKTYSQLVREHNQVTSHHTALLLSIYYALASEAIPRFNNGEVNFFGKQPIPAQQKSGTPFVDLRLAEIQDNRLFIEGIAILREYSFAEYSDVEYLLKLNGQKSYTKALAKAHRPYLTRELFDGKNLVIYDKGWFATYQFQGLDFSDMEKGTYQLEIVIKHKTKEICTALMTKKPNLIANNSTAQLYVEQQQVFLKIK